MVRAQFAQNIENEFHAKEVLIAHWDGKFWKTWPQKICKSLAGSCLGVDC